MNDFLAVIFFGGLYAALVGLLILADREDWP